MTNRDETPDPAEIGARLRDARERVFGLGQIEFAERAGIHHKSYNGWETGRSRVSLDGAVKLREAYGLDLEFIFFGNVDALPHSLAKALSSKPASKR